MANQRRYTIRCLLYTKHDTNKLLTIFNLLPHLISLLLAACECTTVRYTTWRHINFGVILRCPFCWCSIVVCFLVSSFGRFISHTNIIVGSDACISHFYGMPLLRIEPRIFGVTNCSLVTILILLTQLQLLATSWIVFPGSCNDNRSCMEMHSFQHNTYSRPAPSY